MLAGRAVERAGLGIHALPGRTRSSRHLVWSPFPRKRRSPAQQVVSALAGCAASDDPASAPRAAFLKFQLGPVQDFIAAARSIRDLWSGSYLLSWLMAAGMRALSAEVGPDAVIFPNLRGQPRTWSRSPASKRR